MINRTYASIVKQLDAMQSDLFTIGIYREKGMLRKDWNKASVLKNLTWLKKENQAGANIYIYPAGQTNNGLILIDDLTKGALLNLSNAGFEPCLVIETSPLNFQAWVKLSIEPIDNAIATKAAQYLSKEFKGDPNSAAWQHFGRLAGFTNRKSKYINENGHFPFVLLHNANQKLAIKGADLITQISEELNNNPPEKPTAITQLEIPLNTTDSGYCAIILMNAYKYQTERLTARYGANIDYSKMDFMIVMDLLKKQFDPNEIITVLIECSPNITNRKSGHLHDYATRTVTNARQILLKKGLRKD